MTAATYRIVIYIMLTWSYLRRTAPVTLPAASALALQYPWALPLFCPAIYDPASAAPLWGTPDLIRFMPQNDPLAHN